jgi:two-component system chemotaxis response regulator CheB
VKSSPLSPARVMIVEDSLVVRQLLAHIIARDPRLILAAAVSSAEEALREIRRVQPDVISMDIRLPGMDGLEATRRIMSEHPTPIVVIAGSIEDSALKISMNALRAGALSVVEKPVGVTSAGYEGIADTICTQLDIMSRVPVVRQRSFAWRIAPPPRGPVPDEPLAPQPTLLTIAASTGGPPALAKVLGSLPADFPIPILLVQHMGAPFMEGFASWLDGIMALDVAVAREQEIPRAGRVYVAPGDRHLMLSAAGTLQISASSPLASQRPSATMMFRSVAKVLGPKGLGVLLTGMGEDGAEGLVEMRQAGAYTIAEDESTAVVYGMPAAALRMGGVRASLPLDMIAPRITRLVADSRE